MIGQKALANQAAKRIIDLITYKLTQVQQHAVALAGNHVRHNRGLEARVALLVPESGPRTVKGSRLEARHRDSERTEGCGISTTKLPTAR
uniref:Uncharacterized protein n=1 Tax=Manihot esculenta TaxID=3983 RepID=A0A2C9W144_MANES